MRNDIEKGRLKAGMIASVGLSLWMIASAFGIAAVFFDNRYLAVAIVVAAWGSFAILVAGRMVDKLDMEQRRQPWEVGDPDGGSD